VTEDNTVEGTSTIKFGGGYNAPWFVARGSVQEQGEQLVQAFGLEVRPDITLAEIIVASASAANALWAAANGLGATPEGAQAPQQQAPQSRGWGGGSQGRSGASDGAPAGVPGQTCQHGQRQYKSGQGAKGPWAAWMCPAPKGTPDQCKPIDAKTGKEWG
jgi:hypothetical protein